MSSGSPAGAQASREDLEQKISQLQKEKSDLEREFGLKRAKFRELFLQKEDELKKEHEKCLASEIKILAMDEELSTMHADMDKIHWELEGVRTAAALSEANKQEEISSIISDYQQEVSNLQQLLKVAEAAQPVNAAAHYKSERNKLVTLNVKYEEEIQELRNKLSQEKESFLSAVAKSIKRVGTIGSNNISTEQENLEESMRKAQEDAQILKSVVVPLESEIKSLKSKLEETEAKLVEAQKKNGPLKDSPESKTVDSRGRKSPSLPDLDSITDLNEKTKKLFNYLKAEKAARKDLEMYVAVLSTQKSMLQEEADKVSSELQDVCHFLEEERQSHDALKQTWQMANDQFLESQRLMMMDLRRMEGVLTTEQQRHITDLRNKATNDVPVKVFMIGQEHPKENSLPMRRLTSMPDFANLRKLEQKDEDRQAQEKKVKELDEKRRKHELEQEERWKLRQNRRIGREKSRSREGSPANSSLTSRTSNQIRASHSVSSSEIGDDSILEELDDDGIFIDHGACKTQSVIETDGVLHEGKSSTDSMTVVRISPEKVLNLPSLTDAQMKALTDPTPETEACKSLLVRSKSVTNRLDLEGKRLVSEKEWALLEQEMRSSREKLGQPCTMCSNYEVQLQTVQEEFRSTKLKMNRSLSSEQETNKNLLKCQEELQLALKSAAEDAQIQINDLTNRLQDCEKCIQEFKDQMSTTHLQLQDHCKSLTENREQIHCELSKLQEENDSLADKYSKTAQQLQNEVIHFPSNLEEMQQLLLKYREEVILAKVAKEFTEEKLKSEIVFLKSQVMGEQQEKATLEESMTQEIAALQAKLAGLQNLKQELEREAALRVQTEAKLRETESSLKGAQIRYKQLIGKMQEKLEEMDNRKRKLESDNHTLRCKVHSLQVDLSNSEAVQRDFVKFSQSLQIQLEKIRQGENEVRWQHEDDIDECNQCKLPFTVTRRKHHCRHCGRVFCADCTMKSVASGPNLRATKVCDVCHTILVKDATPYFSTEAPVT